MNSNKYFSALHESGHLVSFLLWGIIRGARSHGVRCIIINGGKSQVRFNDYFATDFLSRIMVSDLSPEERQWYIQMAEPKLAFYLAGCAAEAFHLEYKPKDTTKMLKLFYRSDKSPNNDIQQAIELNVALGKQKRSDGVLPLVDAFNEALCEVEEQWELIIWTAKQMEEDGVIEGVRLDRLIDEIQKRLNKTKS